ncbi:hypothetical protein ACFL0W_06270 [Nanoarchaeota archaeon]
MRRETDIISKRILEILNKAEEPLETREIELILKDVTRIKVLYRLNNLRGDGLIKGKPMGSGKGAWIWWRKDAFQVKKDEEEAK